MRRKNIEKQSLPNKPSIGVSSCLLGQKVRFDGGHKRFAFICDTLAPFVDFKPYCPEMALGFSSPRPAMHLSREDNIIKLVVIKDEAQADLAPKMRDLANQRQTNLQTLSGYIFKNKSPSCGVFRVKVYHGKQVQEHDSGVFAKSVIAANPLLPVEEEGRLGDARLRENFIERVYVYARWQALLAEGLTKQSLIAFHAQHKYALMAHHLPTYEFLGKHLADLKSQPLEELADTYIHALMAGLRHLTTRNKHVNVLQHCLGYLKHELSRADKQALLDLIKRYQVGQLPLIVPITVLKDYLRKHPSEYLAIQTYFDPYPDELMLRNAL